MVKGYYTAKEIVIEALAGVRDYNQEYFEDAAMYFMKGYRDFQLFDAGGQVKEAWRPIKPNNTVLFPEDLLRLLDVGIQHNGDFFSFTERNSMVSPITDPLDSLLDEDRGEQETLSITPTIGYGAKGANVEYYYKEDRENRRVILKRMAIDKTLFADRTEVLFRYVGTGVEDLENTFIASDAANLLTSYIEWKLTFSRPDIYDKGYIMMKKEDYIENQRMYAVLELPSIGELVDAIYETSGQNIRRL